MQVSRNIYIYLSVPPVTTVYTLPSSKCCVRCVKLLLFGYADGTNPQQGAENRQPLPNPWQRGGGAASGAGGAAPGAGAGGATGPGLINTPGMQSLLQQMSENPRLVQSMLSAPYTNTMLQALAADPDMASQLINQVFTKIIVIGYLTIVAIK